MRTKTRKIDELNRVILPAEVKDFGWSEQTPLDIALLDDEIVVIQAHKPYCKLCGSGEEPLFPAGNAQICESCLQTAIDAQNS